MNQKQALSEKLTWKHIGFVIAVSAMDFVGVALMLNSSGIFYPSVAEEFGVGLGQVSLYITIAYLVSMPLLPLGERLMNKISARTIYVVTNLLIAAGFFINSMASNVWMLYLAGAISAGNIVFNMYLMPVLVARWFKKRVGMVVGIAGACSGLGAALWNVVGANVITTMGWRAGYASFGILILVLVVPLMAVFVRSNPEDVGVLPYGAGEAVEVQEGATAKPVASGASYSAVIKSPIAVFLVLMALGGGMVAVMSQYLTSFAVNVGYATAVGATMTSAAMIGNMVTKVVFGSLADKSVFGAVTGAVLMPIVGLVGLMLIGGNSAWGVVAVAFLYGGVQPSNTVLLPLVIQKTFGDRNYGKIWGSISPFSALACAIGATCWGWIYDGTGSFIAVFVIAIALLVMRWVAYVIMAQMGKKVPWTTGAES